MATNLHGKKMCIHQDAEVKNVYTPTQYSYNSNMKNIFDLDKSGGKKKHGQTKLD